MLADDCPSASGCTPAKRPNFNATRDATSAENVCTSPEGLPLLVCVPKTEPGSEVFSVKAPIKAEAKRSTAKEVYLKASKDWGECLRRHAVAERRQTEDGQSRCGMHEKALAQAFVDARASEGLETTVSQREEFRQMMRGLAEQSLIASRPKLSVSR
jgi:hypothetical protein